MSPFLSGVVDSTMRNLRRERDRSASEIGARAAAAGSFGGSREAIQRGQLDRNMMETAGSTVASLMGAGYDKATATALANAQLRQQADTGNADRSQQTTLANANFQQDAGRTNYQGDLQRALTNAQLEQQASMQNANFAQTSAFKNMDAINTMRSGALDYSLKAPQVQSQLDTQRQARELQGAQAVLGAGNQQQQFAQGNFDTNRAMLDWYKQYIPQVYNQDVFKQTEKDDGGSGLLNGVLGIGSSLIGAAGKAGGFGALLGISSDETGKTDITKLGKDPETGVEMYAYRYKDDPKTYPKVVGPMAQELERDHPGTTRKIGGKMVVDVGLLSDALRSVKKAA